MKFIAVVMSLCVSLASAGVVIIPIKPEQVVPKASEDCYFGVVTPMGCGTSQEQLDNITSRDKHDVIGDML
ncbi:Secreted virulence factor mc69 [Podospora pseudocomata]|uniref:Secreted virulence factor mc69 n=1 Tax=Podospora pseudocomata TaxID=2093779 RepID=A0ABR0GWR6_9PEZI|nr:Secreted virulence factor mc69 [Podospora pseudocomata]